MVSERVWQARSAVFVVALAFTLWKLYLAKSTFGSDDVLTWSYFANDVRAHGPIGIYGHSTPGTLYNHPPLSGWMLVVINAITDATPRITLPFLIRVPSSVADLATAMLVFELLRGGRKLWSATLAGLLVAASPVLLFVSGFHGNTDPVFVMFTLLSFYLLTLRNAPLLAGLAFAAAISVKLVCVVAVPLLIFLAARQGLRHTVRLFGGMAALGVPLWLPVLLFRFTEFKRDVVDYGGVEPRQWGIMQLAHWAELSSGWMTFLPGPGRYIALILATCVPVLLAWRRPEATVQALGLTFVLFLLFSPAGAAQYLAWPAAAAVLVNVWAGALYNLVGGYTLLLVYNRWNYNPFPRWYHGHAKAMNEVQINWAMAAWVSLLVTAVVGLTLFRPVRAAPADATDATDATAGDGADEERTGSVDEGHPDEYTPVATVGEKSPAHSG